MSPTQFAASVLAIAGQPGGSKRCWLCGGECGDEAQPLAQVIAPTFTQHNLARCADSTVVCNACEAMTLAASWQAVVERRSMDLKVWTQAGWHSYSHYVSEPDVYECPRPSRVREILLSPPKSRWLLGINESGKKHTIFRCAVNSGGDAWGVHFADRMVRARTQEFAVCLELFEAMVAAGFSKASVVSGDYHPATLSKVGLSVARRMDAAVAPYRSHKPDLLGLVAYCAFGVAQLAEAAAEPTPGPVISKPAPVSAGGQLEMF